MSGLLVLYVSPVSPSDRLQYEESRLATEDEEERVRVQLQCLVATTTVLTELNDTRNMFGGAATSSVQMQSEDDFLDMEDAIKLQDEALRQATLREHDFKLQEEERSRVDAKKLEFQDPKLLWFQKRFPVLKRVGDVLNSAYIMPFWIIVLVLDCLFLLFWEGYPNRNHRFDDYVTLGHFVVSLMFAVDLCLRFSIHAMSHSRWAVAIIFQPRIPFSSQ
jgi:hypothetical protein